MPTEREKQYAKVTTLIDSKEVELRYYSDVAGTSSCLISLKHETRKRIGAGLTFVSLSFVFDASRSRPCERSIDGFGSWIRGLRCWERGLGSGMGFGSGVQRWDDHVRSLGGSTEVSFTGSAFCFLVLDFASTRESHLGLLLSDSAQIVSTVLLPIEIRRN